MIVYMIEFSRTLDGTNRVLHRSGLLEIDEHHFNLVSKCRQVRDSVWTLDISGEIPTHEVKCDHCFLVDAF